MLTIRRTIAAFALRILRVDAWDDRGVPFNKVKINPADYDADEAFS